jgi:hypothetical protein
MERSSVEIVEHSFYRYTPTVVMKIPLINSFSEIAVIS